MSIVRRVGLPLMLMISAICVNSQQPKLAAVDFRTQIQPILASRCQDCHHGDAAPANLRLDSPASLLKGSNSGAVIAPGNSAGSLLIKRISDRSGKGMPPSGEPLSDAQIALIAAWINQGAKVEDSQTSVSFASVQPIFASACYACHSGAEPKGGLDLSVKSLALKGGNSGPVIIPGNSSDSRLLKRVLGANGERQMPLAGRPLTSEQIAVVTRWIQEGANWPDTLSVSKTPAPKHWAYVKPVRPSPPAVMDAAWVRNAIDRFVLARLEKEGLKPSPEASKETLIRRVSLDLIGLPPTPVEIDEFISDTRVDAYERLVDRLLSSPRYGERWATPWLDLARYGDSNGLRNDRQREAWPYRDWVIKALNQNMPFDQFTIEQLAGDLLPNATVDQKIATGFVRSSTLQDEGGTDPAENNWNAQLDRASTVGTVWLGSTVACAQCHNHKFDPFTQKQFYQLVAFFNNVAFSSGGKSKVADRRLTSFTEPMLDLATPYQAKQRDEIMVEINELKKQLNDPSPELQKRQANWERAVLDFEKQWQPLHPSRLATTGGTILTPAADDSALASGNNPAVEDYILEAKVPVDEITAFRIEALPDPSLPRGGPGRDYYGNFMVYDIKVEAGSGQLTKVAFKEITSDDPAPRLVANDDTNSKQLWLVDATHQSRGNVEEGKSAPSQRLRVQLLLIPEKPLKLESGGLLRVTIQQKAEIPGVNLGRFRVSVTAAANPKSALEVPALLRPVLSIPPEKRTSQDAEELTAQYRKVAVELAPVRQKIDELTKRIKDLKIVTTLVMDENPDNLRPSAYMHDRGAFVAKGDLVQADVPAFLGPLPTGVPFNRLGLAKWLVSRDNPLTARVTVNHFWQTIFGRGIVETAEDFGTQGSAPSHPELLDWLATEFMDKWDVKALQRLIVTSSTYRQSSAATPTLLERDPSNSLLARGPRFRVEAEMVRDIALAAAGILSSKMFGPPVKPYQPAGLWDGFPGTKLDDDRWLVSPGEDRYRRGLYVFVRRSVRYPSMTVFDAPSRETCTARRDRTDTPLQALATLNDPAFFETAQAMARRIEKEGGSTASARAVYGFRLVTARKPAADELDMLLSAFEKKRQYFEKNQKEAEALCGKPDAELAAWTIFSNALLNLDEILTKE